jgi:DNA-binding NarL/FixJ family response regulator
MDLDMPVMDGVDATHEVAARFPNVMVLILSGIYHPEKVDLAMRAGAAAYLPKDLIATHLIATIVELEPADTRTAASL